MSGGSAQSNEEKQCLLDIWAHANIKMCWKISINMQMHLRRLALRGSRRGLTGPHVNAMRRMCYVKVQIMTESTARWSSMIRYFLYSTVWPRPSPFCPMTE